jgi:V/A-type H+-transporting ATPase subunit D
MKADFLAAKKNLILARKGFSLLETKHAALLREINRVEKTAREIRERLQELSREAERALTVARAEHTAFSSTPRDCDTPDSERAPRATDFDDLLYRANQNPEEMLSYVLKNTFLSFDEAFFAQRRALSEQEKLDQTEKILARLKIRADRAKKRAAALKNIAIPAYEQRVKYFSSRIEENERDETVRLRLLNSCSS